MRIRLLAEDSDIAAVDSAFKLLSSPDIRVATDAKDHVFATTHSRIGKTSVGQRGRAIPFGRRGGSIQFNQRYRCQRLVVPRKYGFEASGCPVEDSERLSEDHAFTSI